MATVNLSWTPPSSVGDVDTIEIYRFENQQSADTAALITLIGSATAIATVGKNDSPAYSDTSAPVGALTYCAVSKNTAGFKLESSGHADVITT